MFLHAIMILLVGGLITGYVNKRLVAKVSPVVDIQSLHECFFSLLPFAYHRYLYFVWMGLY